MGRQAARYHRAAAAGYEALTRKRATRGRDRAADEPNAFVIFLGDVFAALDIDANAERAARDYVTDKKLSD